MALIFLEVGLLVFCSCFKIFSTFVCIHCTVYCCLCVYRVLCYLVLWPQDWINTTTTTSTYHFYRFEFGPKLV